MGKADKATKPKPVIPKDPISSKEALAKIESDKVRFSMRRQFQDLTLYIRLRLIKRARKKIKKLRLRRLLHQLRSSTPLKLPMAKAKPTRRRVRPKL